MPTAQQISQGSGILTGIEYHTRVLLPLPCRPVHARVTTVYHRQKMISAGFLTWTESVLPAKSWNMQLMQYAEPFGGLAVTQRADCPGRTHPI